MPCSVCGSPNTVRSHIIPRALIHDSKDGHQAVIYGERGRPGYKFQQSGKYDHDILCELHERITGDLDKYAVDFIRAINLGGQSVRDDPAIDIPNPDRRRLVRFALSVIWREVFSANGVARAFSLGGWSSAMREAIFADADIQVPIIVSYQRFTDENNNRVPIGIHPFRVRMLDRNFWQFAAVGCAFWTCVDSRGLPEKFDGVRADLNDPARVIVGDPLALSEVGILQAIFRDMRRRR